MIYCKLIAKIYNYDRTSCELTTSSVARNYNSRCVLLAWIYTPSIVNSKDERLDSFGATLVLAEQLPWISREIGIVQLSDFLTRKVNLSMNSYETFNF